jgi:putative tricarboxylic transport membrane protein
MRGRRTGPVILRRNPDVLSGLILLAVAAVAWIAAGSLPFGTLHQPGAGLFPKSLAILLWGLALALWFRGLGAEAVVDARLWPDRAGLLRVAIMCATLVAYVLALETAGYLLATAGMFLILLRWVGRRPWSTTILTAGLAAAASYLVFARWLMVSLPAGIWVP